MSEPLSVASLFSVDFCLPSDAQGSCIKNSGSFAKLASTLAGGLPSVWSGTTRQVFSALGQALDVPLVEVFAADWNKYRSLLQYLDSERYPPEVVSYAPLATHTLSYRQRPTVGILVAGKQVGEVHFEAAVELTLNGAVLTIQAGRFMELRTGSCKLVASLRCEGALLCERSTEEQVLPGVISFGDGVPIAPERD